ncbi:MAG: hypothetical protein EA387_00845 [Nitriliruptor sp.]|nr:MAG: hypothetical protein EA387_00845 [Nitriliruptor sp.]
MMAATAAESIQYCADSLGEVAAHLVGLVPIRRYGSVGEVAAVAVVLCDASYGTGTNTEISGSRPVRGPNPVGRMME